MSRKSLIKRIFSIGKSEGVPEEGQLVGEMAGASDVEGPVATEEGARPSITEILFKRRESVLEDVPPAEGGSESIATMLPEKAGERRLNKKEETAQRMTEGFENLSGLLRTINDKLEDGNERGRLLADSVDELPDVLRSIPETNRAQIEFLGTISKQLDMQTVRASELSDHFSALPEILKSIPEGQQAQAAELQAIASQLSENSVTQMEQVADVQQMQRKSLVSFQSTQNKSLNLFHKAQQQSLATFRGAQTEQSRQMEDFIASTQRSMRWTLVACACIVSVAALGVAAMIYLI